VHNGRGFAQLGYLLLCPPTPGCKLVNEWQKPNEISSAKRSHQKPMIVSEPLLKIVCPAQVDAKPDVSGSGFELINNFDL